MSLSQATLVQRLSNREADIVSYRNTRVLSETLVEPLSAEDQTLQSMPDASPAKWHLAHTSWFFETFILSRFISDYQNYNDTYQYLFNSYYQAIGPQYKRAQRGMISRPGVSEVAAYRQAIDTQMGILLEEATPETYAELQPLLFLGINHEQQHQELLLTDIKHAFSFNPLFPVYRKREPLFGQATELKWVEFPGGLHEIGHKGESFCFDNETPHHKHYLESFKIASRPVVNGEFIAFIEEGGYQNPSFWLSDGWAWLQENTITQPLYWQKEGLNWYEFTLAGLEPVQLDMTLTHINYYEAHAFATWSGHRLPTEMEWEVASQLSNCQVDEADMLSFERLHPGLTEEQFRNIEDEDASPEIMRMFGGVWEWTQSAYSAYPGFKTPEGAIGEYNGKFMANQMVLRGGSCVTPEGHIRPTYRNFFPAHAQWQFSGIRLARDVK